jgi:hypothetical protein
VQNTQKLNEYRPVEDGLDHVNGQMDGQKDMTKPIFAIFLHSPESDTAVTVYG